MANQAHAGAQTSYASVAATSSAPVHRSPFRMLTFRSSVKSCVQPDMNIDGGVKSMAGVVGSSAVVAASKMSGKAVTFLRTEQEVFLALSKGITVSGIFLLVRY